MQFVFSALMSVFAVNAVFVSAHPAAPKQGAGKSVSELHEEFTKLGTELHADLNTGRVRKDFKGETHIQSALSAIQESDRLTEQLEKDVMDPKHPLSLSETEKLTNNIKSLASTIVSELRLSKPEHRQDQLISQILQKFGRMGLLMVELASKQGANAVQQISSLRQNLLFK